MPARRTNPHRVKLHRSYSVTELANCLAVHKNTVRHWQAEGLTPVDANRPTLFDGRTVKTFLVARNASRKRPTPPGMIYCLRCREPQPPALGMVEFIIGHGTTGNLMAICEACGAVMHRRANRMALAAVMPGLAVQIRQAPPRISERACPSLNCDKPKD